MDSKILKDRPIQGRCYACTEHNYKWFVSDTENPYTQEKPFWWIRQRVLVAVRIAGDGKAIA